MTPTSCSECERPVPDSLPICETCVDRFVENLKAVPGLIHDLTITRSRLDKVGQQSTGGGKSAETPMYVRLSKTDEVPTAKPAHQLELQLVYWGLQLEIRYRKAIPTRAPGLRRAVLMWRTRSQQHNEPQPAIPHGHNSFRAPYQPQTVAIAPITTHECIALWLAHNPELIRTYEDTPRMVSTITRAIDRAKAVVDQRPEKNYVAPCPTCQNDLYAEKGAQWVKCRRCREQHETAAVKREAIGKFENTYCTIAQIADYLELLEYEVPPRQTMHNWHYHGRLRKRGWLHTDKDGRTRITLTRKGMDPPVFRLGDVLRIMERKQAKGTA